jgi:hypothetical protein
VEGYKDLQTRSINKIDKPSLEAVYTLKFNDIEQMFKEIYVEMRHIQYKEMEKIGADG